MTAAPNLAFANVQPEQLEIAHQVDVNPLTGAANVSVPLRLSSGRDGFGPRLSLNYSSSGTNSAFGIGWDLAGLLSISRDTRRRLPRHQEDDVYAFSGPGELIPAEQHRGGIWRPWTEDLGTISVQMFRPRVEQNFVRVERWTEKKSGLVHWRSRDAQNTLTIYGREPNGHSRIADPADPARTFAWLPDIQYDRLGNAIVFEYVPENRDGVDFSLGAEWSRLTNGTGVVQRYLKRIRYGNTVALAPDSPIPAENRWLFEIVFDYGDHRDDRPAPNADRPWFRRPDPFSSYRPGFELRTYRLCRRVLMFHAIEALDRRPTLVGAYRFDHSLDAAGSRLEAVHYTGYRLTGANSERELPPLRFTYSQPVTDTAFVPALGQSVENVPQGLTGASYRWLDLYGEGLPGIFTEAGGAWYFKSNEGYGAFGTQRLVTARPAHRLGDTAFRDFDGDGNGDLVAFHGRDAGYYEYDRDTDAWNGFRPFSRTPHVEAAGAKAQWLDLDGDGRSDLVLAGPERLTWYPLAGKDGFEAPVETQQTRDTAPSPPIVENGVMAFYFADMTGDGLVDQVRVENGQVEYWPNLGHGRFGPAVSMADAPTITDTARPDPRRLLFVDVDGDGAADLVYVGKGEIRIWINGEGNRLIEGPRLTGLPMIDDLSVVQVLDFLGDGTPTLVWSSPLPGGSVPIHYLPLTGGTRPNLLLRIDTSTGRDTTFAYSSSASHYLRDKRSSRPWQTRIPSHVTVVDRREIADRIGGTRVVSRFEYRDGYHDGPEQTFRGFARVDQYDTEIHDDGGELGITHTTPSCLRTWHHVGRPEIGRPPGSYDGDPLQPTLSPDRIEDVDELLPSEYLDGLRALAGRVVRQEVYAVPPTGALAPDPFQVVQHRYNARRLQPQRSDRPACFAAFDLETLTYEYEQNGADPRVSHRLAMDIDRFGNVGLEATVAYARRPTAAVEADAQRHVFIHAAASRYLNVNQADRYEIGIQVETREFDVRGLAPAAPGLLDVESAFQSLQAAIAASRRFDENFQGGTEARLIAWARNYYWNDARDNALPLGDIGGTTLLHHTEEACFTPQLIQQTFGALVTSPTLRGDGGYSQHDGYWWRESDVSHYLSAAEFFRLSRLVRGDGGETVFTYDPWWLTAREVRDPAGNRVRAEIDYHLVAPFRIIDQNDNVAEVLYDPLGVQIVTTHHGEALDAAGRVQPYGQDPLARYVVRPPADFRQVLADPVFFIQAAASFTHYDLNSWAVDGTPLRVVRLERETLTHDASGAGPGPPRVQVTVTHLDGFRRPLQIKTRVEPGPAIVRDGAGALIFESDGRPREREVRDRWLVSGHTLYNQKQQPVRQYEPFFSATAAYEPEAALASFGVFQQFLFDALGRQIRADLPNGTHVRSEFSAWSVRHFDANDTVRESLYRTLRESLRTSNPERRSLDKALAHADTPTVEHLDPRGLSVKRVELSPDGNHRTTERRLDINGEAIALIDGRGLTAFSSVLDMQGRALLSRSIDAGDVRTLFDRFDQPVHIWDARGVHIRRHFDRLDRPTSVTVDGALGLNHVTEQMVYGDEPNVRQAIQRNARGRLVTHHDQAGTLEIQRYEPSGQVLASERRFLRLVAGGYEREPDWAAPAAPGHETDVHASESGFDGLGRVVRQRLPDGTTRTYSYLQGGGLGRVIVSSDDGLLANSILFDGARFNARGQRLAFRLGNGVEVTHAHDPETFRTRGITAVRPARAIGEIGVTLQDFSYTYDPVGNITISVDRAQERAAAGAVIQGLNVSAESDFTYDAFYQLTRATGRVHQALLQHDYRPDDLAAGTVKGTRHIQLNDGGRVERYTRTYAYDLAGNLQQVAHVGATRNWTTDLWTSAGTNRGLPALDPNGLPVVNPEADFDANGNCRRLAHLRRIDWSYRNAIARAVVVDRADAGQSDDAEYYIYDGAGTRARKISERRVANVTERIETLYLDGCERRRIYQNGNLILERWTSHISDETSRIALIHRWGRDDQRRETDRRDAARIRYQLTNHLGSSQLELDEWGNVISYEEHFPFGGTSFIAGDAVREVRLKDYRFCGKERDDATGLYYFEHRYYAPWIGKWLSPDPIGPEDDINLYRYVFNNPVNFVDPEGLEAQLPDRAGMRREPPTTFVNFLELLKFLPSEYRSEVDPLSEYHILIDEKKQGFRFVTFEDIKRSLYESSQYVYYHPSFNYPTFLQYYKEAREHYDPIEAAERATHVAELEYEIENPQEGRARTGAGGAEQPAGGEHGEDGTGGGAHGADGAQADSHGSGTSRDTGGTGTHSADGSSTATTLALGGTGGLGVDLRASTAGRGRGGGGMARGRRVGTGNQPGREAGLDATGGGTGAGAGTRPGGGTGGPGGSGGVPGGLEGGVPGRDFKSSVAAARVGSPNGIEDRSLEGVSAPSGQTFKGEERNDSRTGTGAGDGGLASIGAGDAQSTTLDRAVRYAGYYNLEFDDDGGKSGGVPGGVGPFSGAPLQAAYLALTAVDVILTVLSGGGKKALQTAFTAAKTALKKAARSISHHGTALLKKLISWWTGKWFRTFYSVQSPSAVARLLLHGGEPWPTGYVRNQLRDILGQGLYTFGSKESAEAYLNALQLYGAKDLKLMAHRISKKALSTLKAADFTKMSDEAATAILEMGGEHNFDWIIRMTGTGGLENFFRKEVFPLFKNWVL